MDEPVRPIRSLQLRSASLVEVGVSALHLGKFDVDEMNEEFAFVIIGKGEMIVWFRPGAHRDEGVRLISMSAFRALSQNARHAYLDEKGKEKTISYADLWMSRPERRDYAGIEFFPNPDGADGKAGYLNLWTGFSVAPKTGGRYSVFRDHLLTNVCDGDQDLFRWLFGWCAQIVQEPRKKTGTAVVLRGGMGYGKTVVGEVIGSLFANHYVLADDPRYLTGNFNAHMASCLLLQADEAIWAGDKAAEGRLKGLITSSSQMIEGKGVDPVKMDNFQRVIMTSNNDWVVPAGKDERRFAVFDVAGHAAQNHGYFGEMADELDAGGRETLLHDLLSFDLSTVNLRVIPKTAALLEQKIHSLDPIETWLLDRLQAGTPTKHHSAWPDFVPTLALFDDYRSSAEKIGVHRRSSEIQFGMRLTKLVPAARRVRRRDYRGDDEPTTRVWGYDLPTLDRAREDFESLLHQEVTWPPIDESG